MKIFFMIFLFSCTHTHARKPSVKTKEDLASMINEAYFSSVAKISVESLEAITKGIKKYPLFTPYKSWVQSIEELKASTNIVKSCKTSQSNNYANIDFKFLKNNFKKKCFRYVYSNLDQFNARDVNDIEYIFQNKYRYVSQNLNKNFFKFYNSLKLKKVHKKIEKEIINQFFLHQFTPRLEIAKEFFDNKEFLSLYKKLGSDSRVYSKKAIKNFKSLIRNMYNAGGTSRFNKVFKSDFSGFLAKLKGNVKYLDNLDGISHIKKFITFLSRNNKSAEIREVIKVLEKNYKSVASIKNDTIFYYIWSFMVENNYKAALKYVRDNRLINRFNDLYSRPQYAIAEVFKQNSLQSISDKLKLKLIITNTISFYATLAVKDLKSSDRNLYKAALKFYNAAPKNRYTQEQYLSITKKFNKNFERIRLFNENSLSTLMVNEVNVISATSGVPDEVAPKIIAIKLQEYGAYLSSFIMIYKSLEGKKIKYDRELLMTSFPRPFKAQIDEHKGNLNPILIYSLMRQESSFNQFAKSGVGARGLMQLMPKTAERFDSSVKISDLNKPEVSISIGVKYLEKLAQRFQNNVDFMLASYNAGEGRVDEWKKNYLSSSNKLKNIENIPFQETRKYVKLINRNIFFYNFIEEIILKKKDS